jgi:hypothetical protein
MTIQNNCRGRNIVGIFKKMALAGVSILASSAASAATYSSNFSAMGSGGTGGYYFFIGHTASQTFNGTGLASASGLELNLNGLDNGNYVTESLTLTFQLNGNTVGSTTYNPGDSADRQLNFSFADIVSASTDYTLYAFVSGPVCSGCGAVQFGSNNPFTLTSGAVPEPASWAMMIGGFALAGAAMRRRQSMSLNFA